MCTLVPNIANYLPPLVLIERVVKLHVCFYKHTKVFKRPGCANELANVRLKICLYAYLLTGLYQKAKGIC